MIDDKDFAIINTTLQENPGSFFCYKAPVAYSVTGLWLAEFTFQNGETLEVVDRQPEYLFHEMAQKLRNR